MKADKKSNSDKNQDVGDLTARAYQLVLEQQVTGLTQNTMWKMLNVSSRDASRLITKLEKSGLIRRERVVDGGRWTYKLVPLRYPVVMRSIETIPCITCSVETQCKPDGIISPITCPPERESRGIADWVLREFRQAPS